jgi:hypothetical protein
LGNPLIGKIPKSERFFPKKGISAAVDRNGRHHAKPETAEEESRSEQDQKSPGNEGEGGDGKTARQTYRDRKMGRSDLKVRTLARPSRQAPTRLKNACVRNFREAILMCTCHVCSLELPICFFEGDCMAPTQFRRVPSRLLRGEILNRWEHLTTGDIEECGTDRSKLIDILQARYGYAKTRAEREVELFLGDFQDRLKLAV